MHAHGAAVMCQITHLGRRTYWNRADWLPVLAPSPVREPAHRSFPKAMEEHDIRRIVRAYGAAARRCRDGAMDGIEIEAYGHLLDAFWSPATNRRTDDYGGSLENRMRFCLEVLDEIRREVGHDYIVGIRMVLDEDMAGGLGREEGLEIARRLVATGMLDFVNVIRGHIDTDEGLSHVIPGMGTPAAPHLAFAGEVRAALGVPTFHAARIGDIATANHAITRRPDRHGRHDPRAHGRPPHRRQDHARRGGAHPPLRRGRLLHRSHLRGRRGAVPPQPRDRARGHHAARDRAHGRACAQGRGGRRRARRAGGGAGRGGARPSVVLFEAAPQPGGQVRLAAALARRREIIGIVDWLASEVRHLGVELRCNLLADAGDVLAEQPDVVIIATGGVPNTSFLAAGEELAATSWDILSGQVAPAREVLLFDDNGAHPGASCAEFLARAGARLELVTPERIVLPEIGGTNYPAYFKAFGEHGVAITLNRRLRAIRREGNKLAAVLYDEYARASEERLVDQVVIEHGTLPADELYFELKPQSSNRGEIDLDALLAGRPQSNVTNPDGSFQLFRVGDAVASRNIHAAIYNSLRLCKDL